MLDRPAPAVPPAPATGTGPGDSLIRMDDQSVTMVGVDTRLLEELRAEEPGKPDRELIEGLAHRKLGMSAVRRIRARFDLPEDEAIALGVRAVHDARRDP